jgi:hypothetical protein
VAATNPQDGARLNYRLNWVANYSVQDPAQPHSFGVLGIEGGPTPQRPAFFPGTSVFMAGNRMSRSARMDLELVFNNNDFLSEEQANALPWSNVGPGRPPWAQPSRHDFPPVSYPADARALVPELHATAGAFPRDPLDNRVMRFVSTGIFDRSPIDRNPAADTDGLPFSAPPPPPVDTDSDGMPDGWELGAGLDPRNPTDGNQLTLAPARLGVQGYTNLEVYLHERSLQR